jgi:hypothetical protein
MKKKKKHEAKAKKGHAHGAQGQPREGTLARLIAEAKVPERPAWLVPEPVKLPEDKVFTPPEPKVPTSTRLPLLEALASADAKPEVVAGTGSASTIRRPLLGLLALVAAAACVFGVMKRCEAPSVDEVDAATVEEAPDASSPALLAVRS